MPPSEGKLPMSAGSVLQRARKDRKLSLTDVTEKTKIQPWVLEAIETDRLQELMSPVYVKGFITTYAKFLRLEPEPLLAQLSWPQPEPAQEELPPAPPREPIAIHLPKLPWPLLRRGGAAVAVGAAVVGLVILNPIRRMPKLSLPALSLPKFAKTAPGDHQTKTLTPKIAKAAAVKAVPAKAALPEASHEALAKSAAEPPASTAQPQALSNIKVASVTPVNEPLKPPSPPTLTLLATQPLELAVTATRATWIKVRADGKLVSQQRLARGANERWTAKKQFELVISKPSQVEVTLNGQPISPFAIAHQGRILITHRGITQLPNEE